MDMEPMFISKVDMIRLQSWFNNPNQAGKNNVAIPAMPPATATCPTQTRSTLSAENKVLNVIDYIMSLVVGFNMF
jgi:hypothetical protein